MLTVLSKLILFCKHLLQHVQEGRMNLKPVAVAVAAMVASVAWADSATITGGASGGVYQAVYGANLAEVLKAKGHEVKLLESRGSLENLQRLGAGEAQLGFAQLDAYAQYLKSGGPPLEIVVSLGQECGYLVVKKDGKVTSEKDLRRVKEAIIAIGEEGSGSAITWQYMTTLVPDYRNARIVYQGGTRALNQIGTPGGPDAFLFITAPDHLEHKLIQAVNANKELRFVDMDKGGLDAKLPDNNKPIYEFGTVPVCSGSWGCKVDTICTSSYLFASANIPRKVIEAVSDVMAMSPKTITEPK